MNLSKDELTRIDYGVFVQGTLPMRLYRLCRQSYAELSGYGAAHHAGARDLGI